MSRDICWEEMDAILQELVTYHQDRLLKSARRHLPHLTPEDILQPNDFPELEYNPQFRYDEGILCGIRIVQTALQAHTA